MQPKYYVDASGVYIGAYCGVEPPDGVIEVEIAPDDARQLWLFPGWSPVPTFVPQEVTRFQAKAALAQAGLLPAIEEFVSLATTDIIVKLAWQDAQTFKRTSVFVAVVAEHLALTDEQIDELFIAAGTIE